MKKFFWLILLGTIAASLFTLPKIQQANDFDPWVFAKEYPADLTGETGVTGEVEVVEDGIFLTSLMEAQYGTPYSTGLGGAWSTNNDFTHLSNTKITIREPILWSQKSELKGQYTPASLNEPLKGGKFQVSHFLPIYASNNMNGGWEKTKDDFRAGNYGLYLRLEFPPGVDAQAMAKCIDWSSMGASTKFNIRAMGIPTFSDVYFPVTAVPRYTKYSKEDPSAIYLLIRGVDYRNFSDEQKEEMTTPAEEMENLVNVTGLGFLAGEGTVHYAFDISRYTGNLSTEELLALGVTPEKNPQAFEAADNSPGKILTRGNLPPHPSNSLPLDFYILPNDQTLSPEVMGINERSTLHEVGDTLFVLDKIRANKAKTNLQVNSWSSYFSPIDILRDPTGRLSPEGLNLDSTKSYNLQSQLDSQGGYHPDEFLEVINDSYTQTLPGENLWNRSLTLDHHGSLMTYLDLNNPALTAQGGRNNRFVRVVDFFTKEDITNNGGRRVTVNQQIEDSTGSLKPLDYFLSAINEPQKVIFSGSAMPTRGNTVGPILPNQLTVQHIVDPPNFSVNLQNDLEVTLGESITLSGQVSSVESNTADVYYSIGEGEWIKLGDTITGDPIIGEREWQQSLPFTDVSGCGEQEIRLKAVDKFGLESNIISQKVKVLPREYHFTIHYWDLEVNELLETVQTTVDDTQLVDGSYPFQFRNYKYNQRGWKFEYGRIGEDSQHFQEGDYLNLALSDLQGGAIELTSYLIPVNPGFEVPNIIDFGDQVAGFAEAEFFPEKIDGKLHVLNRSNLQHWQLYVTGEPLKKKVEGSSEGKALEGILRYYKDGQSVNLVNNSFKIFDPQVDPDASTEEGYEISQNWTYAKDLGATAENQKNGFSLFVKGSPEAGAYEATINWTVVGEIDY